MSQGGPKKWRCGDGYLTHAKTELRNARFQAAGAPDQQLQHQSYKGPPRSRGPYHRRNCAPWPPSRSVRRLRFHYCFKRLHQILTARITSEPIYELKTGFCSHAYPVRT